MADEEVVVLTQEGFDKLQAELDDLKYVKRKELAARIKLAISYGDLKENSEYHSAKDDQAFMETRIMQLEKMLIKARIAEASSGSSGIIVVGSNVVLKDIEFGDTLDYQVVGPAEADVANGKISYESPLGKALMGKKVGEKINVDAPMGTIHYELLEVKGS
ncbi:transcription elongation factor GreA [Saccharibacillus brassicae]|uniref:Transcription elongation factor GreA n=1 Tax=Saccharibacillus brassicae TaxID=2583377 RepID=A0A4Y6UXI0_SACBS|nr:transcription elongation factor GreA [Saccharibacillus brassicae]QDH21228.1 transcription elongation factor GreA [Saccharibacillus brassicae]